MKPIVMVILSAALALPGAVALAQQTPQAIVVTSPTLKHGERVPTQHTPDGRNDSPAINWSNVPQGAQELVLFCEDPGVGNPPPFVHWVVYGIPPSAKGLPAAMPIDASPLPAELAGTKQGLSGFRRAIYRGPAPPPGKPHDYHFVVYALDKKIETQPDQPPLTRAQLLEQMEGHVIGKGELVATYDRS